MELRVAHDTIAADLVEALRAGIKTDQFKKPVTGVVRISEFKRSNVERYVDPQLLPNRTQFINLHMWDHLKGHIPEAILAEIDHAVLEAIEDLEQRGYLKRGGQVGNTKYPEDDWLTLTIKGVKALSTGENPLEINTDDAAMFDQRAFHAEVCQVSRGLFGSGHYPQAVFEACKALNLAVKTKSGLATDGAPLMTQAFSVNNPVLRMNALANQSDRDEQQGFMHLFQGTMLGIRNPSAHELVSLQDPTHALEHLSFLSMLFRKLDAAQL